MKKNIQLLILSVTLTFSRTEISSATDPVSTTIKDYIVFSQRHRETNRVVANWVLRVRTGGFVGQADLSQINNPAWVQIVANGNSDDVYTIAHSNNHELLVWRKSFTGGVKLYYTTCNTILTPPFFVCASEIQKN